MSDKQSLRIKKSVSRYRAYIFTVFSKSFLHFTDAIAKIFVYSMAVDGEIRTDASTLRHNQEPKRPEQKTGFIAGSKALDFLDRLITSTESFFHPSNSGPWTLSVRLSLLNLAFHV